MTDDECRRLLIDLFETAVAAAAPSNALAKSLPDKPRGRIFVIGAGKASAEMAAVLESSWPDIELTGVVATRYGHSSDCKQIKVIEAGHPVPDRNSVMAATEMLALARTAGQDDLVLALMSGGGSACLALPVMGITLEEKQAIARQLLRSGAPISAINRVRKALSAIKGGKLAAAAGPARVHTLVISDVPGDNPADVASGPTVPDRHDPDAVFAILDQYKIVVPIPVRAAIAAGKDMSPERPEDVVRVIASPAQSLDAIATLAHLRGLNVVNLGDRIEGEAAMVATQHAIHAIDLATITRRPTIVISGGETTVTIRAGCHGSGGRNCEYQLALARALERHPRIWSIAGDSDGIDGVSDAAGAIICPDTLKRAEQAGIDIARSLTDHDSYNFFARLDDLVFTGPTRTNVNDIRIQLII